MFPLPSCFSSVPFGGPLLGRSAGLLVPIVPQPSIRDQATIDRAALLEAIRAPERDTTVRYRLRSEPGQWVQVESRLSFGSSPSGEVMLTTRFVKHSTWLTGGGVSPLG